MRLLVCGSRDWTNRQAIRRELTPLSKNTVVIHGFSRGADRIAGEIAYGLGLDLTIFPANWNRYGKPAGVIRNQRMLDEGKPDIVYAFHHNLDESTGTADMVERAKKAGIPVAVFDE